MIDPNQIIMRPDSFYAGLEITDDIMFATTMGQNPELITALLREMLPNEAIGSVVPSGIETDAAYSNVQQAFFPAVYAHGTRYDVFHTDGRRLFDVEMHNSNKRGNAIKAVDVVQLIKRTRYAHSVMDITSLRQGENYLNLKRHYVIYICTFDLIGEKGYRYEPIIPCFDGYPDKLFDEDRRTIFFNTKGSKGELTEHMKDILKYMDNPKAYTLSEAKAELVKRIDAAVKFNQQSPVWRRNYEVLAMREHDIVIEGRREGQGEEKRATARKLFIRKMTADFVHEMTGLPIEEILAIQKEYEA